jgi:hypothetical protein
MDWPDVDDVVALNADTEVMRYLDHGRPMMAARVFAEEMPRLIAHNGRPDRLGSWVARDRGSRNFLGWFMITLVDEPLRTAELDYWLLPTCRPCDGGRRRLAPTDGRRRACISSRR